MVQRITQHDDRIVARAKFVTPGEGGQIANGTDVYMLVAVPKNASWDGKFDLVEDRPFAGVIAETNHFIQ
jgi:hypothetical protein